MRNNTKERTGQWYIAHVDEPSDPYRAGYEGNVFATELEAADAIDGLAAATNTDRDAWLVAQY